VELVAANEQGRLIHSPQDSSKAALILAIPDAAACCTAAQQAVSGVDPARHIRRLTE
jgi:hypothetical protein